MIKSIIIVEDEPLISMDLEAELQDRGWTVIGTAGTLAAAKDLAAGDNFDVALLDLDLQGQTTAGLAECLVRRNKSVVFLSGTTSAPISAAMAGCPRLAKPVDYEVLAGVLDRAVSRPAA